MICGFFTLTLDAQETDKEEMQYWANRAKLYKKRPMSLKAEFDNFQQKITKLKEENEKLSLQVQGGGGQPGDSTLKWELYQTKGELEALREEHARMSEAYRTRKQMNVAGVTKAGLLYRVQIGAFIFKKYNIDEETTGIGEEVNDGFNKYVIGGFRTVEEAEEFRLDVIDMGIDDAFIVPYIDGIRVSMDEAKEYEQNLDNNFMMGGRSLDPFKDE